MDSSRLLAQSKVDRILIRLKWKGGDFYMVKKGIPFIFATALVLSACTGMNNGALPPNNETPMDNIDERERNWAPEMRDERRGGTDIDGINDFDNEGNTNRNNRNTMDNNNSFQNPQNNPNR